MSAAPETLHVYTYKAKLCEARPGDPPILVPKSGTNCAECQRREEEYMLPRKDWRKRENAHIAKLEAEWAKEK
jgi:hypothetical protein